MLTFNKCAYSKPGVVLSILRHDHERNNMTILDIIALQFKGCHSGTEKHQENVPERNTLISKLEVCGKCIFRESLMRTVIPRNKGTLELGSQQSNSEIINWSQSTGEVEKSGGITNWYDL